MKRIFLFLIACLCLNLAALGQKSTISLNENWKFKQEGKVESYPAQIPGTIHTDLLNSKLIPDPFFGENEQQSQVER